MKIDDLIEDIFEKLIKNGIYKHDLPEKDNLGDSDVYDSIYNLIEQFILKEKGL